MMAYTLMTLPRTLIVLSAKLEKPLKGQSLSSNITILILTSF